MKKSQVLATIALAFALGVVAPIANTASAFEVKTQEHATDTATGTATCDELDRAVAKITGMNKYKNVENLINLVADYEAAGSTYKDIDATTWSALYNAINPTFTTRTGTPGENSFDTKITNFKTDFVAAIGSVTPSAAGHVSIDQAQALLDQVKNVPYYEQGLAYAQARDADGYAGLAAAVTSFRNVLPGATTDTYVGADGKDYLYFPYDPGTVDTAYGDVDPFSTYYTTTANSLTNWYKGIAAAAEKLQAELDNAKAARTATLKVLDATGFMTGTARTAFETNNVTSNQDLISYYYAVATTPANFKYYSGWDSIVSYVKGLTTCDAEDESETFGSVWGLARLYKRVSGRTEEDTKDIAIELIGTAPIVEPEDPSDPEDPGTDVPTDPSDKTDTDTKKPEGMGSISDGSSFGTPDTGAVAKSEGSASASVAIMAAISTVIAGFGAAIVAIRNFKRNKNA